MRRAYSVDQIREAESRLMAELGPEALMDRAATGLAAWCGRLLGGTYGRRVVVLAGRGNNGGDALYAGAALAGRGARVDVVLVADAAHTGGLAALRTAGGQVRSLADAEDLIAAADLVLDGILGIGGSGALCSPASELAVVLRRSTALVVAVDVPSGIDSNTGAVTGPVIRAGVTVTFGAHKPGLLVSPAAEYAGVVELVDLGLDFGRPAAESLQDADTAERLPRPTPESTKYRRGVLGLAAGSESYPGAAVLAAGGALRTGVGMLRFVGPAKVAAGVRSAWPEAVVTELSTGEITQAGRVQAWAVGPGLGTDDRAHAVVAKALATELPVVLDADALTIVAADRISLAGRVASTLLTPHAGELAQLLGATREELEASPLVAAREAARRLGCVVLLKGSTTVVATPEGRVRVNTTGSPLLATAGSGDVLTGAAGALLASGLNVVDAASCAAYLHGRAAMLASRGAPVTAADVLAGLPAAIRSVG